ncbi:MAG: hypothetical protein HYT16_01475 [DPANN group archaeon]|nr:hypothetical protein [DPANN group archaeon]
MRKLATLAVIIVALALGFAYLFNQPAQADGKVFCASDSDCVQKECCHPVSAVNKAFRPDCSDTFCTAVCQPNTLDCNQGKIKCIKNKCEAIINE